MKRTVGFSICLALFVAAGCSRESSSPAASAADTVMAVDGSEYLLAKEPAGASGVSQAREKASDGENVVLVGRIGGRANPWIEGRAAFSVVDGSLKACSDIPGDACPQPWDYCCETEKLPTSMALVKVVDGAGALVKADARRLLDVKELSTVVVAGKAQRDDAGNLTVLAHGVYVKEK